MSATRDPDTDQVAPLPAAAGVVGAHNEAIIRLAREYGYGNCSTWMFTTAGVAMRILNDRRSLGLRKYGTVLHPNDGRDHLRDLIEELADATAYAECLDDETTRRVVTGCLLEVLRHWQVTQWPLEPSEDDSATWVADEGCETIPGAPVSPQNERTER